MLIEHPKETSTTQESIYIDKSILNSLIAARERFGQYYFAWSKKSGIQWLQEGDKKTKLFHDQSSSSSFLFYFLFFFYFLFTQTD